MADPAAAPMTIDFLRARLLSERSVSRASKERADQLAARVAELEEQVRAVTAQRQQAEREAAEVLAVLESRGFCGSLSDVLDSGSDADDPDERDEPRDATVNGGDPAPRSHGDEGPEQEQPPAKGGTKEEEEAMSGTAPQPGGLSWKGRCASPRRARQLKQRHRRSYVYFLASQPDPSPKYRMGQSCRKNKRKELSVAAVVAESRKEQRDGPRCADDDGRTELDGEVGGDDRRSSGDGGGQYVMRRDDGDGEMERVLEKQAELIGQYEAQEKAQTDWEKNFNDTWSSLNKGDAEADCQVQARSGGDEKLIVSRPPKNSSEEMGRTAAVSAQGSSTYSTATRQSQGDANSDGCSSHYANSASSSGLGAVKAPSESSPSVSKVSDWSSTRFHDHADQSSSDIDVESVLQALQRARISLRQKLDRPLPPSQVTLALPAPGDEYRADLYDDDDGSSSYRDERSGSSPSRQEILALPAPEDYHGYHDHGSANCSTDGADTALTEKPSGSSRPRQEILALPAPGDDRVPDDDIQDDEVKIPVSSPGLFRLPTDSFPKEETLPTSNGHGFELGLREATRHDTYKDDEAGVSASARQLYDPHGSAATSGRCGVPTGSGFTVGGPSFLSGIPGLPEDLRKGGGPRLLHAAAAASAAFLTS
ncbi:hypothetical protein ACQJBY_028756 [Aegilops geniculata]